MADWASDGEEESLADLGTLDLPEVENIKLAEGPPQSAPPPQPNAWRRETGDVRSMLRGGTPNEAPRSAPPPGSDRRVAAAPDRPAGRRAYGSGGFGERGGGGYGGGYGGERGGYGFNGSSGGARTGGGTVLYVTNLPSRMEAGELAQFFADAGCVDVKLTYHNDTGNVKSALVTLGANGSVERALSYDGRSFGSRSLHVKVDDPLASKAYGSAGFGSNGLRRAAPTQADDPSIPTGPPPAGRKRLNLKPRTKPLPTLDIDHRAIDQPGRAGRGASMDDARLARFRSAPVVVKSASTPPVEGDARDKSGGEENAKATLDNSFALLGDGNE